MPLKKLLRNCQNGKMFIESYMLSLALKGVILLELTPNPHTQKFVLVLQVFMVKMQENLVK